MDSSKISHPPFQEGDARVVEAYAKVLEKVTERSDASERMQWFDDIESLLKLLSRGNVTSSLKGALQNAIAACACVSSAMKQKVCCLLEQYGLPVLPIRHGLGQHSAKQEYDFTYELTEVEARQREYLCTLSYLQLSNCLSGHGLDMESGRYYEIFQFVREQVFGMYSQRLYVNPVERWELVVAALHHFEIILSKYEVSDEDMRSRTDNLFASGNSLLAMSSSWSAAKYKSATPALELMKDLKNGGVIFSNLMSILMLGVKSVLEQRASQLCGQFLEEAVSLSFQIFIHSVLKESIYAEACHTSHQASPSIIFQDVHKVVTLLEYVRYDKSQVIQRHSVKVMELFSARMPELVSVLRVADAVSSIIEGYAACLEARFLDPYPTRNPDEDTGSLILRLLLVNLSKPPPNLTHLLLGFDVNQVVEKSKLEPNEYFSCLTVILRALDTLARPEVNAGLHELGFQLLNDLCVDPVTCGPMVDLLRDGKYDFLPKKTSPSSHDTCPEKGFNSFISGTDPSSPEALFDLERQSRDNFDSPAESAPDTTPATSKPEVGFLNPEPLASRAENDGLGESSALKSSWIQRLFPGLLDESAKAGSQWNRKGKQVAADSDESERLLLENNATQSPEGPGSSFALQHQGRLGSSGEDGSRKDSGSQPPSASTSRQGLSPAEDINLNQDCPMDQDTYAHESGTSLMMDQEAGKSTKVSFIHALKYIASDVDTRSSQGEYQPVQRQSPTVSRRFYQQAELNLDGVGSSKERALETQSPRFGKFEFQQGVTRISSYMDDTRTGKGVEGTMRMDDVNVDEVDEAQDTADVGPSSRALPPLSLFAPFKHSKERRGSALSEGPKTFEETPSTTPLFSSRGYKAPESGKFDSSVFALYKPLSLSPPIAGSPDFHGNLMSLTPIFAPFKMVDEPNGPSTSFIKTERLHAVDIEEQERGKNILEHDNWIDAKAKQLERQGQLSAMHGPRSSSIYSRTPLPVVSDERKAHSMFSPSSQVPRFNEPRLSRLGITGIAHEAGISKGRPSHTVNTAAIELNSRRPSLQDSRADEDGGRSVPLKKEPLRPQSDVQLSASQGMRDLFQFDQDLQRQRVNAEAEAVRPFSNPVSEPSSGSSPVSAGARSGQHHEIKVASASSSEVKGKKTLEGPSVVVEDAEWDQINATPYVPDRGTASTFNVAAQSSEAGLLSRRMAVPDREERLSFLTGIRNFDEKLATSAQEGTIPGRSSRKRTHDARTRDSQFSAAQNSEPAFAVPQNRDVEGESRATPRPQSWLQRWMPKPAGATGFKTPQFAGSTPSKNRRLSMDSDSVGGEQEPSPSRAGSYRDDQYQQNANPLFAGEYPVPSAAAMAIVGAANRRSVPLPSQRVGTRIAVWPATTGMLMRRAADSESPEVLTAQVDVEVVVEARHE